MLFGIEKQSLPMCKKFIRDRILRVWRIAEARKEQISFYKRRPQTRQNR
jgi:hypothetical protein